jgi:non-homologous end joining protein Ku
MSKATYLNLRFGGAVAPVALFATSGKPREAAHETKRFEVGPDGSAALTIDRGGEPPTVQTGTLHRPVSVGAESPLGSGDVGDPLADLPPGETRYDQPGYVNGPPLGDADVPPAEPVLDSAARVEPGPGVIPPVPEREMASSIPAERAAQVYVAPLTTVQQGVHLDDGTWVDLTERFAEIDERTKLVGPDGKPVMEVVATIASSAIGRERIRNAKYVGGADPKTYKVLRLLWLGLRANDSAAVVRWAERTTQRLGIIVAKGGASEPTLVLLECEWAENMRPAPPRVIGPQTVGVTPREADAAKALVKAMHAPPSALNDLRDERLAKRAELLKAAREGKLTEYAGPAAPAPLAEVEDVAEALLAGVPS